MRMIAAQRGGGVGGLRTQFTVAGAAIAFHLLSRQQLDCVARLAGNPSLLIRGAAGFTDNQRRRLIAQAPSSLITTATMPFEHPASAVVHGNLEHVLCQISSNGFTIHGGLLLG